MLKNLKIPFVMRNQQLVIPSIILQMRYIIDGSIAVSGAKFIHFVFVYSILASR